MLRTLRNWKKTKVNQDDRVRHFNWFSRFSHVNGSRQIEYTEHDQFGKSFSNKFFSELKN